MIDSKYGMVKTVTAECCRSGQLADAAECEVCGSGVADEVLPVRIIGDERIGPGGCLRVACGSQRQGGIGAVIRCSRDLAPWEEEMANIDPGGVSGKPARAFDNDSKLAQQRPVLQWFQVRLSPRCAARLAIEHLPSKVASSTCGVTLRRENRSSVNHAMMPTNVAALSHSSMR